MARKPTGGKVGRPKKGDLVEAEKMVNALATREELDWETKKDPYKGLTERQQLIARYKLRGLSQQAIAGFMKVSQPVISKEMKRIRAHMIERGETIDQDRIVGETTSLYEEVEYRAWELYTLGENSDKAKALSLIMTAREKHTKLLMDLGRLERAGNKSTVEVHVSPLVKAMQEPDKKALVTAVVKSQLTDLEEPAPPLLTEDIVDAEIIEDD
jgi:predicted transcriptional regulator